MHTVPAMTVDEIPSDALLLDVREPDEWAAGRAPEALHIPMHDIPARVAELPQQRPIAVICRSGGRSHEVTAYLVFNHGFSASNVLGGMHAWAEAGRPMVADSDGQPYVA